MDFWISVRLSLEWRETAELHTHANTLLVVKKKQSWTFRVEWIWEVLVFSLEELSSLVTIVLCPMRQIYWPQPSSKRLISPKNTFYLFPSDSFQWTLYKQPHEHVWFQAWTVFTLVCFPPHLVVYCHLWKRLRYKITSDDFKSKSLLCCVFSFSVQPTDHVWAHTWSHVLLSGASCCIMASSTLLNEQQEPFQRLLISANAT